MTTRERMLAVYQHQMPDKFPVGIYSRYLPRGAAERELRGKGLGIIDYYPLVSFIGPPWHNNPGFTSEIKNTNIRVEYSWGGTGIIERRTYETPVGSVWQEREASVGAGSEHTRKHYICDIEDYKIMAYIIENTVIKSNEAEIVRRIDAMGDDGVVLGRMDRSPYQKLLIELAGAEQFLVDLYMGEDAVTQLMEVMGVRMDESIDMAMNSRAKLVWQPDNVTSDMTPPNSFREYVLPYYKKLSQKTKATGKTLIAHMDGKIKALKDDIAGSGIDVIESFSLKMIGGDMELAEAREAFSGITILPNFPSNLSQNSEEEILDFLGGFKVAAGEDEPYMLQVSEDLADDTWKQVLPLIVSVML